MSQHILKKNFAYTRPGAATVLYGAGTPCPHDLVEKARENGCFEEPKKEKASGTNDKAARHEGTQGGDQKGGSSAN